ATDLELDRLFDEGAILRTHVMRPTWHFVLPEDIRWLQELTSARVVAGIAGRYRQLELDDRTIGRAMELFAEALSSGRFLTRAELGEVLQAGGILAEGQRLPHLIAAAELAHLLPNFDELTVAYRDRGALLDPRVPFNPSFFAYYRESTPQGGMLSNVVTIAGRVRGAWSRTLAPKLVRVHVRPLAPFSASD